MTKYKSKDLQELVPKMREKGFYIPKKERKIDWNAYTQNQIDDIVDSLTFIREEIDNLPTIIKKNKVGRPPTDIKILAKAILFAELLGLPERKAEGWLMLLGHHLGIHQRIDDRVLGKAYKNPEVLNLIYEVFKKNKDSDGELGGDGTGLERSRKENYESTKKKNMYMTSIVDSREIVQAFDISGKQECRIMHDLVKSLADSVKKDISKAKIKNPKLTLDAGFVDRKLSQLIKDSGLKPYIFPKANLTLKSKGSPAWKNMWYFLLEDVQKWLREYHIRSHTESFHSSFKRIFGIVTKILDETCYIQVLSRIIHNNRRKLNYFEIAEI